MTPDDALHIVLDAARQHAAMTGASPQTEGVSTLQCEAIIALENYFTLRHDCSCKTEKNRQS